jgi:hypothetical protein
VTDRVKLFYSMKGFSRRDLFYTIGCKKEAVSKVGSLFFYFQFFGWVYPQVAVDK